MEQLGEDACGGLHTRLSMGSARTPCAGEQRRLPEGGTPLQAGHGTGTARSTAVCLHARAGASLLA